ncbi:phosphoglucomutase (alpha-D-glucose-1,6-bisphosphate-dependent) [Salvia divinorum]|uniref:Phosphoglucomutase (Alpha-D-glucose-1,6-bisphosphate-dependent) n=1 Tax=Salvia divinorum TaxID=28513 RepID=A0ABD1GXF6_SALDI
MDDFLMIFVTPSDSVAIIAANAENVIQYFKTGLKGLARSMTTSGALDRVAEELNLPFYEVPTEESFVTSSGHIYEKDGTWTVLAWLSIIAFRNKDKKLGEKLVSVSDECEFEGANKMIDYLRDLISKGKTGDVYVVVPAWASSSLTSSGVIAASPLHQVFPVQRFTACASTASVRTLTPCQADATTRPLSCSDSDPNS